MEITKEAPPELLVEMLAFAAGAQLPRPAHVGDEFFCYWRRCLRIASSALPKIAKAYTTGAAKGPAQQARLRAAIGHLLSFRCRLELSRDAVTAAILESRSGDASALLGRHAALIELFDELPRFDPPRRRRQSRLPTIPPERLQSRHRYPKNPWFRRIACYVHSILQTRSVVKG